MFLDAVGIAFRFIDEEEDIPVKQQTVSVSQDAVETPKDEQVNIVSSDENK